MHSHNDGVDMFVAVIRHSEHVLQDQARKLGLPKPVENIYCIGDNICTDIFGANLYNKYLESRQIDKTKAKIQVVRLWSLRQSFMDKNFDSIPRMKLHC